jgi:hypothetical protein
MDFADNLFMNGWADLPGVVSREICEYDDKARSETPGKGYAFIHQPSGTNQFVGSIQAEKSPNKSPILCERNPDPNAEQLWLCGPKQVCVDEVYCHGLDQNGQPLKDPLQGYFYKITWGVAAPADMKFTPYVDENGVALRFNLFLEGSTNKPIFRRGSSADNNVIELKNGASDGGVIVKYLPDEYTQVCIRFGAAAKDDEGTLVNHICAKFVSSSQGEVEYGGSTRTSSVTSTSPEVTMNI